MANELRWFAASAVLAGCVSNGGMGGAGGTGGLAPTDETGSSDAASDTDAPTDSTEDETGDAPLPCVRDDECNGGSCIAGVCCGFSQVCAAACCDAGSACLFGTCIAPGESCSTNEDCPAEAYCEPAFGEPGGGFGEGPANVTCSQPLPPTGRCVDRPVGCEEPGADRDRCVPSCSFAPSAGGFDASMKWEWGQTGADTFEASRDVWSTPTVGRVVDANCDGRVDEHDPPNIVFVSGESYADTHCFDGPTNRCRQGVLRVLDGRSGALLWSLDRPSPESVGFAGVSTALGDVTGDGSVEIVALTGEGHPVLVANDGTVLAIGLSPIRRSMSSSVGGAHSHWETSPGTAP